MSKFFNPFPPVSSGDLGMVNVTFSSLSPSLCVRFTADGETSFSGFNATYTKLYKNTSLPGKTCLENFGKYISKCKISAVLTSKSDLLLELTIISEEWLSMCRKYHVMPREKRWGGLDSCFWLVGPHQQSILQLLSLA